MISVDKLNKISDFVWEIPKSYRHDMKVPARIIASLSLLEKILQDRSIDQLINVTTLSGIKLNALAMPDAHEGYGFPIGGIAATEFPYGAISPGGIGYDINCGVRLLLSDFKLEHGNKQMETLAKIIYQNIPSGVGQSGFLKINKRELDEILNTGMQWMNKKGYCEKNDQENIESKGTLSDSNSEKISDHAKSRGISQLGTMGAGNHFVEVGYVNQIFDKLAAENFNLSQNQITVLIHTGSRGLGHQVATDYIRRMLAKTSDYKINLVDRELSYAPFNSYEGRSYFQAMSAAANFAWANRQLITFYIRKGWKQVFGNGSNLNILYDVAHNIAKIEDYKIGKNIQKLIVHRKGATRAFGPGNPELPPKYRSSGQPVIIPGSMGTSSYVLKGTDTAMDTTFGSTCHGAGRNMSRSKAKKIMPGRILKQDLKEKNISVFSKNIHSLSEEGPFAYKNIDEVIKVVDSTGIAKKVARLKPLYVIKG